MIEVGDLKQFGFRIGPITEERLIREVSIFICGFDATYRDNCAYLPTFICQLELTSQMLKKKIDFVRCEGIFGGLNVTQIHNLLLHGNPQVFRDEREWQYVSQLHGFANWTEITDGFAAFLIPYYDRLHLTYQARDWGSPRFDVLDVIDAVETTPYYLIATIDEAIGILKHEKE